MSFIYQPSLIQVLSNSKTLSANNTTANVSVFQITGSVYVSKLYGIVTTVIGSNHTGAYFNLYDQTTRVNITLNTGGMTLSSLPAGTAISKVGLAGAVGTVKTAAAGGIIEPTTLETELYSPFQIVQKAATTTEIDYTYSTTNAPTSGVIQFWLEYELLGAGSAVSLL